MAPASAKTTTTKTEGNNKTETKKTTTASTAVKIPAFLDCTITAKANSVVYDNLNLTDVSGKMIIKDEAVALQNVKTSIFGGNIGLNGNVSTKGTTPKFNMGLALNSLDITQSFTKLEMLKSIAPIAEVITGKFNSTVNVSGNLDAKEMTPDLKSLTGDLAGSLANTVINTAKSKVLTALTNNVKFLDPSKLNLNQKVNLTFSDGKVNIQPFNIKYQDIDVKIQGTHGFDQVMNYNIGFDVPAKYLGSDVTKLLATLKTDGSKVSVPVNAIITGSFQNPKVSTDLSKSVTSLTTQLVQQQKEKYINQATDKGKELLGNLIKGGNKNNAVTKDTTKTTTPKSNAEVKQQAEEAAKATVKNAVNNLFKKKDKKE